MTPELSAQLCLMSKNILLKIQYDGTNYSGWQTQNNAKAIQDVVEAALSVLHKGKKVPLIGCSRTDAGVHALGYCSNFTTELTIPGEKFPFALNPILPDDIKIVESKEMPEDFHARYSVKSKTYIYKFYPGVFENPLLRNQAWHVKSAPDLESMNKAAKEFIGTYDFTAFMATGGYPTTTTRTIFDASVSVDEQGMFTFSVTGDGFLYNMVRIMTGTVYYAGVGKISPDSIKEIIASKDRKKAGITAPAHGLYLYKVNY